MHLRLKNDVRQMPKRRTRTSDPEHVTRDGDGGAGHVAEQPLRDYPMLAQPRLRPVRPMPHNARMARTKCTELIMPGKDNDAIDDDEVAELTMIGMMKPQKLLQMPFLWTHSSMWAKIFVPVISRMTMAMTRPDFGQDLAKVNQWVMQELRALE
uniref:HDC11474 n=1 Tax=Drosophila melanogaster TaxID=7227 RepID=Q6IKU1_DROME|nr:TPA_inf: HDC11474 [Drosophila melanogaster]